MAKLLITARQDLASILWQLKTNAQTENRHTNKFNNFLQFFNIIYMNIYINIHMVKSYVTD